jgi:hypothetical protein
MFGPEYLLANRQCAPELDFSFVVLCLNQANGSDQGCDVRDAGILVVSMDLPSVVDATDKVGCW